MQKVPTLDKLPAFKAFSAAPNPKTASILTNAVLKAVERLDGQASPILLETIQKLQWPQFHPMRHELTTTYVEHTHTEENRKQAIELYMQNSKQAYYDGKRDVAARYSEKAIEIALKNGWHNKAFEAAENVASYGLSPLTSKIFAKLAVVAREIGDNERAEKYQTLASCF